MTSAVSLDFTPNYKANLSFEKAMLGKYSSQSASAASYLEETDEDSSISAETSAYLSRKNVAIGTGKSTEVITESEETEETEETNTTEETTDAETTETETSEETTERSNCFIGYAKPYGTTTSTTTSTESSETSSTSSTSTTSDTSGKTTSATTKDGAKISSGTYISHENDTATIEWNIQAGRMLNKSNVTLTLAEMRALKAISEDGKTSYYGEDGAKALATELYKKGVTVSVDGATIIFGDNRKIKLTNKGVNIFDKIVNGNSFQNAFANLTT